MPRAPARMRELLGELMQWQAKVLTAAIPVEIPAAAVG